MYATKAGGSRGGQVVAEAGDYRLGTASRTAAPVASLFPRGRIKRGLDTFCHFFAREAS